jgi:two-component system, response regulator YesN
MPKITDHRIRESIRLIKLNFDEEPDFNRLAETLNLSPSRLRQLFKEQTGLSFRKYLRCVRIRRAKRLLETSFLSVKETARRVGIRDISHFVKDFEKEVGLSPARYRQSYHSAKKKPVLTTKKKNRKQVIARTANE